MIRKPHLYGAVSGLIINDKWEILLQKRQNTWYFDSWYGLPWWHIEFWETSDDAIIHEIKEEIWINIKIEDIKPIAIVNKIWVNNINQQYFSLCYFIKNWSWEIVNAEPDKCSEMWWFDSENLPEYMPPEIKIFLKHYLEYGEEVKYYTLKQ